MRKSIVRTGLAVAACAALAAGMPAAQAAPANTGTSSVISADGMINVDALRVVHGDQVLSAAAAERLRQSRERARQPLVLVYDPVSASTGLAHAFDSQAAADAFGKALTSALTSDAIGARRSGGFSTLSLPAGCPNATNISRLYENGGCGGSYFAFLKVDDEPNLGAYGWANRGSSLVVGYPTTGCNVILIKLYPGPNYSYTVANFYGVDNAATYYNFNSAQNDNFESGHSTCS